MRNQKGFVTTEFLIAIIIAFGLTMLTFSLTITLSVVEVSQYAVFSASRAHAAANYDVAAQQAAARKKFEQLISSPALAPLFGNDWFAISSPAQLEIRSGTSANSGSSGAPNFEQEYGGKDSLHNMQGVRASFTAKILQMKLPFLGSVTPDDDGFVTRLNAILIREVSQKECQEYMEKRRDELWTFDGKNRFSKFKKSSDEAVPWEDNGC